MASWEGGRCNFHLKPSYQGITHWKDDLWKQRPEGEVATPAGIQQKMFQEGHVKMPSTRVCLAYLKNSQEFGAAGQRFQMGE